MSALAILLKEAGWQITGSDNNFYEPISGYLKKNKINFNKNYRAENLSKKVDLVVIGKHAELIPEKNPEVKAVFNLGFKVKSLPEVLAMLAKDKNNIIISGSYGKSTCAALLAWCLIKANKNPSYFIGGIPIDFNSAHLGTGKDFVLEGDEYPSANWDKRSKFLHLNPSALLLISGEHDHLNIFPTEKSYKEPYKKLVAKIPKNGLLVFAYAGKNNKEIIKYAKCKKISYSLNNKKSNYYAENIKHGMITSFDLMRHGKKLINIKTKLLGNHNIENIVGCAALLLEQKIIKPADFIKAVKTFTGIKRRIELKNKQGLVPVYEGLGSSYSKTKAIFDALKLHFPKKRIIAVFEPHTFSWRNRGALKWYKTIFNGVEEVILLPPPIHGKTTHDQLSLDEIYNEVKKHVPTHKAKTEKEALALIKKIIKKDDVIALVSSGSLLGLSKSIPKIIENQKIFK